MKTQNKKKERKSKSRLQVFVPEPTSAPRAYVFLIFGNPFNYVFSSLKKFVDFQSI